MEKRENKEIYFVYVLFLMLFINKKKQLILIAVCDFAYFLSKHFYFLILPPKNIVHADFYRWKFKS